MNAINCFILQLSQIPGVSLNIAKAIQQNYKNMLELCKKFNDDENYNCSLLKFSEVSICFYFNESHCY